MTHDQLIADLIVFLKGHENGQTLVNHGHNMTLVNWSETYRKILNLSLLTGALSWLWCNFYKTVTTWHNFVNLFISLSLGTFTAGDLCHTGSCKLSLIELNLLSDNLDLLGAIFLVSQCYIIWSFSIDTSLSKLSKWIFLTWLRLYCRASTK